MNTGDQERGHHPGGSNRRASPRSAVLMTARLYQRGRLVDCVVSNVSATGAKVLLPGPASERLLDATPGAVVMLTALRFGDFPARVVWVQGPILGLHFLLPAEDVMDLLAAFLSLEKSA